MDQVRKCVLAIAAAASLFADSGRQVRRFYPDDPLWTLPAPLPVKKPHKRKIDQLYDFVLNSVATPGEHAEKAGQYLPRALDVNTVDEVPDSEWYTNRQRTRRMSLEELRRGPANGNEPVPPYRVIAGKTEGITPGFQLLDARNRRYFCKPDPFSNPEMATAADVIGSKFFYAFGYNVPENYILYFGKDQISVDPKASATGLNGKGRLLDEQDWRRILHRVPRDREGRYRVMASLQIRGEGIGPFRWYGTRSDDPNDIYAHEHMRVLRGLSVFCSWLNHTDVKANNTYDSVVEQQGTPVIRHHLIDFGASLGSDSDDAKNARLGHLFMIEKDKTVLLKMASLGLYSPDWERAHFPGIPAVGHFETETFGPGKWTSNYPNAAFLNRLPDDGFWAAKQIMAFTADEIRAMVETGQFTDPRALEYLTATLVKRRDQIGRYYFERVLPLDRFAIQNGVLHFEDLAERYKFAPKRDYPVQWFSFDNQTGRKTALSGASGTAVPPGEFVAAAIGGGNGKTVHVYLRENQIVGIERTW